MSIFKNLLPSESAYFYLRRGSKELCRVLSDLPCFAFIKTPLHATTVGLLIKPLESGE